MKAKIPFEIQGLWASLLHLRDNNLNGAFLSKTFVNLSRKSLNTILKLFSSTTKRESRNSETDITRSFLNIVGEKLFVSLSLILLHLLTFGLFLSLIITYVKKWSLKSSILIIPGISLCDKSLVIIWSMMLADVSATASWGPTKESLSLLHKAFVRPVLTYASPGWFPFLCNTATNHLEVLHRAACRVITGCLFSTPSSLLLLEAQLPPLKLTLEHQTLYSFERALRLPPDFSSFYALAIRNVPCRL